MRNEGHGRQRQTATPAAAGLPAAPGRNPPADARRCAACGRTLPPSEFYVDRTRPDGRRYRCRSCDLAANRRCRRRRRRLNQSPAPDGAPASAPTDRTCRRCGRVLPLTDFHRDRLAPGGRRYECKDCVNAYGRRRRRLRPDHYRALGRRYSRRRRAAQIAHARQPHIRPRQAARGMVFLALQTGALVRPDRCSRCGCRPPTRRLHAHHPDYAKPLEVVWLCSLCHGAEHRRMRLAERGMTATARPRTAEIAEGPENR